jgi:hypothetical protein
MLIRRLLLPCRILLPIAGLFRTMGRLRLPKMGALAGFINKLLYGLW